MIVGRFCVARVLASLAVLPAWSATADTQWATELQLGRSDNIQRTTTNELSENIAQANLEYARTKQSRRIDALLLANLAYVDYLGSSYSSEIVGSVSGKADLTLIDDRLHWTVQDNFSQTHRDLFLASSPSNRENINYLATGPDLLLRFGANNQLDLNGQYSRVDYQYSPFDSNRYSAGLAFTRTLSPNSSLSLNVQRQRVAYLDASTRSSDFDNGALYVGYSGTGRNTTLTLNAGTNRISRAGGNDSGSLLRLSVLRALSPRSMLSFSLGQQFTDAANAFGSQSVFTNLSLDTKSLGTSSSPYQHRDASLAWDATGRRTRVGASVSFDREQYLRQSGFDRELLSGGIRLARDLASRLSLTLIGTYTDTDYKNAPGDSKDISSAAGLRWLAVGHLRVDVSVEHYSRTSDVPAFDYTENRLWLKLRLGDVIVPGIGAFGTRQADSFK
jgi:hypothetical protein